MRKVWYKWEHPTKIESDIEGTSTKGSKIQDYHDVNLEKAVVNEECELLFDDGWIVYWWVDEEIH